MQWGQLKLDRGHLFAQSYKSFNVAAQRATFSTWNMFPQDSEVNRLKGSWYEMEINIKKIIRSQTTTPRELYVIAGTYIGSTIGWMDKSSSPSSLNPVVPAASWKVICSELDGEAGGYLIWNDRLAPPVNSKLVHTLAFLKAKLGVDDFFDGCDFPMNNDKPILSPMEWVSFWESRAAQLEYRVNGQVVGHDAAYAVELVKRRIIPGCHYEGDAVVPRSADIVINNVQISVSVKQALCDEVWNL
ncbi:hypothetical protein HDU67_004802, partial [Dinochytrium kinnereticum]